MYYSDYLQLDKILNAQKPESQEKGQKAHDEMLFIIIHQAYELWFKQLYYEMESVIDIFNKPSINDNHPDLQIAVHRLKRCTTILNVLVHQIDIMETMTPMDFLDFRDLLRPASGFQSIQFKLFEARLGLRYANRHGKEYYLSQLKPQDVETVKNEEAKPNLLDVVNRWLERMPFFDDSSFWSGYKPSSPISQNITHPFWNDYRNIYEKSLQQAELSNLKLMDEFFFTDGIKENQSFSDKANRSALFIMLYRDYPLLQLPFQLLNCLLDIDELLATWRWRHLNMVQRIIGIRVGTGGSTGQGYLRGAMNSHYIFSDVSKLTSFLIERKKLPELSVELENKLGFEK